MKIKAKDLSGRALDYAVAMAEGATSFYCDTVATYWVTLHGKDRALSDKWSDAQCYVPSAGVAGDDIIDREGITVIRCDDDYATDAKGYTTDKRIPVWAATIGQQGASGRYGSQGDYFGTGYNIDVTDVIYGSTRREAAMRAYVAWTYGLNHWDLDGNVEVDIPEELL